MKLFLCTFFLMTALGAQNTPNRIVKHQLKKPSEMLFGVGARARLKAAVKAKPNDYKAVMQYAEALQIDGEYDQSYSFYQKLLPAHPNDIKLLKQLGTVEAKLGKWPAAKKHLSQVIKAGKTLKDPYLHISLGMAQYGLGKKSESESSFQKALSIKSSPPVKQAIAKFYFQQGDFANAAPLFEDLKTTVSKAPYPYYGLGRIELSKGNKKKGKSLLQKFLTLSQNRNGSEWEQLRAAAKSFLK